MPASSSAASRLAGGRQQMLALKHANATTREHTTTPPTTPKASSKRRCSVGRDCISTRWEPVKLGSSRNFTCETWYLSKPFACTLCVIASDSFSVSSRRSMFHSLSRVTRMIYSMTKLLESVWYVRRRRPVRCFRFSWLGTEHDALRNNTSRRVLLYTSAIPPLAATIRRCSSE